MVALALLAAACGSGDGDGQAEADATTTTTTAPVPVQGGTLTVGVPAQFRSIDPAVGVYDPGQIDVALAVFDPLVDRAADGSFAPSLATAWTPSADLTTWTVTLRDDVTFSDGRPFDAAAVAAHFDRLRDPATQCACVQELAGIAAIEAADPATVVFHLTAPNASFVSLLAGPYGLVAAPTDEGGLVGTGPFVPTTDELLTDDGSGLPPTSIVLAKNARYWQRDEQGRALPHLDEIRIEPIPERAEHLDALESGRIDLLLAPDYERLADTEGIELTRTPMPPRLLVFNTTRPPFDDVRARRAVAAMIDRDAIVDAVYQGHEPASTLVTPGSRWDLDIRWPALDRERAADLVAEVEADTGPLDVVASCRVPEVHRALQELEGQAADVGLDLTAELQDSTTFLNAVLGAKPQYDVACFGGPGLFDADDLEDLFGSGANGNVMRWSDATVDRALEELRATADEGDQRRLVRTILDEVATEVPVVPVVYGSVAVASRGDVGGVPPAEPAWGGATRFTRLFLLP